MVNLINITALATIMLSMGMQVKFEAILASTRPLRPVLLGLVANFILVPVATLLLLHIFQASVMVSAGFLILAVCPGAPVGPPAAKIARGNVAWSIGIMVMLGALSAFFSPLLLSVLLARIAPDSNLEIDFLAIVKTLALAQLLPLAVGLGVNQWMPKITAKIVKPASALANLLLLVLIGLILATQFDTLAEIQLRGWAGMGMLLFASLGIGWVCGGADVTIRKGLAVTTACRNAAVGLAIVTGNFAGTSAVTAVVAYALVSIVGTLVCAVFLGKASR